ncbi:epididymal-specific lipocalin-8 [Hippopotamus amphibius kiboko]|uniref:epididymal-specific lipocalin-8 n=1 Tax=Hippopotamus amphibius kiboko TaxID=575201 RepID=UPI00259712F2|nr:epididymal-specific lipocalin-8 [Hippopotamus amphibius kiboko]
MEAGLLSAVLGIILVQVEMSTQDLDLQKIVGFWREVGVASSQNLALKTPKRLEALFLTLSGEMLTVKAAYDSSGSCETEQIVSSAVNVSGKFVFPGRREIQVIDTDYEQYAILRLSLRWRDADFHVLKYFTRSLEGEYEPGFWKFRELTADTGLYLVARHGRCAKLLKELHDPLCLNSPEGLGLFPSFAGAALRSPRPSQDARDLAALASAGLPWPPLASLPGGPPAPAPNKRSCQTRCPESFLGAKGRQGAESRQARLPGHGGPVTCQPHS